MAWEPRLPLTTAERHVDFPAHNTHIVERRAQVEQDALPVVRRLGIALEHLGAATPLALLDQLRERLRKSLMATARFGYTEARREIVSLREGQTVLAAYAVPDAGEYGELARAGLEGISALVARRSRDAAEKVAEAGRRALLEGETAREGVTRSIEASVAMRRVLHNEVLELIGETMNMGRTAGALSFGQPPEFALRSAQLDKTSCDACLRLHGEIVQVGSNDYFRHMPPSDCFGGGRCRCIYVFGEQSSDVRQPLEEAA